MVYKKRKEHEMNVIWDTDELKVIKISKQPEEYLLTDDPKSIMRDVIKLSQNELTAFCLYWLELQGYDITEPELEIAPCPNPECGREVVLDSISIYDAGHYKYFLSCKCGYESPLADSASEAIRLHNLMAKK